MKLTNSILDITEEIKNNKVGVIPTDTIYGIVGSALSPEVVEKIYDLRKREKSKPMIVLVSSLEDLDNFGVKISDSQKDFLNNLWPNPVSVVLPVDEKLEYLHRGKKSIAFRMPNKKDLLELLKITGPIVAPSANFEGEEPSKNITDAKKYFAESVDFYVDEGDLISQPSTLIELTESRFNILRQGTFKINS